MIEEDLEFGSCLYIDLGLEIDLDLWYHLNLEIENT
jgi:hypothetical protein